MKKGLFVAFFIASLITAKAHEKQATPRPVPYPVKQSAPNMTGLDEGRYIRSKQDTIRFATTR